MSSFKGISHTRLWYERNFRGWTQRYVAEQIGASNGLLISNWERGETFPSFRYRQKLCMLFEKSIEELELIPAEKQEELIKLTFHTGSDKSKPNKYLKHEREIRGWSMKHVAEQIDAFDGLIVGRWERGERQPSLTYRQRLCTLFEKNAIELGLISTGEFQELSESKNKKKLTNKLKYEREIRGWSQSDVGNKIGAMKLNVGRWERGEILPSPYFQRQLCTLFGKNAEELGLIQPEKHEELVKASFAKSGKQKPNSHLRYERKLHGWSLTDVARQIDTYPVNVSRWERGEMLPSSDFQQRLCTLYGKSLEYLGLTQRLELQINGNETDRKDS